MTHRLRMRAFVDLCMPLVFETLHAEVGLFELRKRGYAPVSFYLDFAAGEAPVAFGSALALDYAIRLYRSATNTTPVRVLQGWNFARTIAPTSCGGPRNRR